MAQVLRPVEEQHAAPADDRPERGVRFPRTVNVGVARKNVLDDLRIDDHDLDAKEERIQREAIAVTAMASLHGFDRPRHEGEGLGERGERRSRGKARPRGERGAECKKSKRVRTCPRATCE
jgi:hypothetical protein